MLEIDSLSFGVVVDPRLEVCRELIVKSGRFETSEDRKNDRPQFSGLFEGTCEETLCSVGKVIVGFVSKEGMKGIKIFELVWVEQAAWLFFDAPELDPVGCRVFLKATAEAWQVGLPTVWHLMVVACRADAVGEILVGPKVSKKPLESRLRDCFAKTADRPIGHSTTEANIS